MLGISTAWRSNEVETGDELLKQLSEIGITQIELDFRITSRLFRQLLSTIKRGQLKVLSVHNYFPLPEIIPQAQANADAFPLSSLDADKRRKGIDFTIKTIQIAHELEARGVVVHLGSVEIGFQKKYFRQLYNSGELKGKKGQKFLEEQRNLRRKHKQIHLDKTFDSLERILKEAEKLQIPIGLENRLYSHEIPNFDEIGLLLRKFSGSPLRYWHDTGHSGIQENLGIIEQRDLLKTYSTSLLGIHFHDIRGHEDHLAPGQGSIDFSSLVPLIKNLPRPIIKVVEVHPKVSKEELLAGFDYLAGLGF